MLPVILFHAGFELFSGGFVGVDIFFVISGYLITTIIINELEQGKLSIIKFYERRARRILPALFVVMFATLLAGYFLLMPDEYKNLGQSFVATSFFSNNILLGLTSGYWDLASEFKPLLHTWSLGIEEQYYVIVPILLLMVWKSGNNSIIYLLWSIFITSFLFAVWFVNISPDWAFYILPTRAWELCIGALTAVYLAKYSDAIHELKYANILSLFGIVSIIASIFIFDNTILSPGASLLIPVGGAVLIIGFCRPRSISYKLLANKFAVSVGLLSYSLYLWHQPVFAFLRAYSIERPTFSDFMMLLPLVFLLSYLTWRFVESPFRNKGLISQRFIFAFSITGSILFTTGGFYLNKSYGMASRVFNNGVTIADMDKRIYNERAFKYKNNEFSDLSKTKILIIGNSFARDFTNLTLEKFDTNHIEIVYRDDLKECINDHLYESYGSLFVDADVIIFASGNFQEDCYLKDIDFAQQNKKEIFYIGTKSFGYNLNWIIQLDDEDRKNRFNHVDDATILHEKNMKAAIPEKNFISLLGPILVNQSIPITDNMGRMLSTDRVHLTRYGAIFLGKKSVAPTRYAEIFKQD